MELNNIRVSKRENFPETNSSSSHSVSISLSGKYYKPEEWNIDIDDGGTIFIPDAIGDFGWEYEKYNDVLTKIQYVSSIPSIKENPKKLKVLKDIIISFTGAKKVIFAFERNYYRDVKNLLETNQSLEDINISDYGSNIDHNSSDVFPQILESRDTIKDFIFNPDSWLFLGNDNSTDPENFFLTPGINKGQPDAIAQVDFGGSVGRVDFEIDKFPDEKGIINSLYCSGGDILNTVRIDRNTGEIEVGKKFDFKTQKNYLSFFRYSRFYNMSGYLDGHIYLMYTSDDFDSKFMNLRKETNFKGTETTIIKKLINDMESPKDYKIFPVHLKTREFGELL